MKPSSSVIHCVSVIVIGAGQAGLCAAYELQQRGFTGFAGALPFDDGVTKRRQKPALGTFVVLDAEEAPGGAWQHRWHSLTMDMVDGVGDLPAFSMGNVDTKDRAYRVIPQYFADFEHEYDLPILRPVTVSSVERDGDALLVRSSAGVWRAWAVINCTGSWRRPFVPYVPGISSFRGEQFHTSTYPGPEHFWKQRVLVVGGGYSGAQHVAQLANEAKKVRWIRNPLGDDGTASSSIDGQRFVPTAKPEVTEPYIAAALQSKVVKERRMMDSIDANGVRWEHKHGNFDSIIWATGFRPDLSHLHSVKRNALSLEAGASIGASLGAGEHNLWDSHVYVITDDARGSLTHAHRQARRVAFRCAEAIPSLACRDAEQIKKPAVLQ